MSAPLALTRLITSFFKASGKQPMLPIDVLACHVFPYLSIEDIMSLRRVNKTMYTLTHEPQLWKTLLHCLNIHLPPLNLPHRLDGEAERLVVQALSLDDNWKSDDFKPRKISFIPTHYPIEEMTILPGGKYLIASIRDEYRTFIELIDLDRDIPGAAPVARLRTDTKPYQLQAKYSKVDGKPVIIFAYVERLIKPPTTAEALARQGVKNISDLSGRYDRQIHRDFPGAFQYKASVYCVDLLTLEIRAMLTADPLAVEDLPQLGVTREDLNKGPFIGRGSSVEGLTHDHPIKFFGIFHLDNKPCFVYLRRDTGTLDGKVAISIRDLSSNSWLHILLPMVTDGDCAFYRHYQSIGGIRILPDQRSLLVIRVIDRHLHPRRPLKPAYILELYSIAEAEKNQREANRPLEPEPLQRQASYAFRLNHLVEEFQITDCDLPPRQEESVRAGNPPPPLAIFATLGLTPDDDGKLASCALYIWPMKDEVASLRERHTVYKYALEKELIKFVKWPEDPFNPPLGRVLRLPGFHRSLVYRVRHSDPSNTKLLLISRAFNPGRHAVPDRYTGALPSDENEPWGILQNPGDAPLFRKNKEARLEYLDSLKLPDGWMDDLGKGMSAIAWEENLGILCLVAKNDPTRIRVVDYGTKFVKADIKA